MVGRLRIARRSKKIVRVFGLLVLCAMMACMLLLASAVVQHDSVHAYSGKLTTAAANADNNRKYPILYCLNGGKNARNQVRSIKSGKTISISKIKKPTREGYSFVSWYKNSSLTKKAKSIRGVSSKANRTLYAKWRINTYKISYALAGGTLKTSSPKSYTVKRSVKLPIPTRRGYTFEGWYTDKARTQKATMIVKGSTGKKTFYAKWIANNYQITLHSQGGYFSVAVPESYTVRKKVSLPSPVRDGYVFIGWYEDAELTIPIEPSTEGLIGDKHLYARWAKRTVVAHRGYHANCPENSYESLVQAKEQGLDAVEVDVRFTSDNIAVIAHDPTIAICSLGIADNWMQLRVPISSLTYEQVQSIKWMRDATGVEGKNILTFDECLDACNALDLTPIVHIKEGTDSQIDEIMDLAFAYGMEDTVRWFTSSKAHIERILENHEGSSILYSMLVATEAKVNYAASLAEEGADVVVSVLYTTYDEEQLNLCRDARLPLCLSIVPSAGVVQELDPYICMYITDFDDVDAAT